MSRRAFTLAEVLIAVALMLVLVGAMYGFLHDLVSVRARVLDRAVRQHAADSLLDALETRLTCAIVADATDGAGVRGQARSVRILSRGVTPSVAGAGEAPVLADLQRLDLRFDDAAGRLAATVDDVQHDLGPAASLRLRYHDGDTWTSEFDSAAIGALPVAVEVAIWLEDAGRPADDDAPPDRLRIIAVPDARRDDSDEALP